LLKTNVFIWNKAIKKAFLALEEYVCNASILIVPNFTKTFDLERDSSDIGLIEVLMQEGCPLAFTSKQLCDGNLGKSNYEKEMMGIIHLVDTWNLYLIKRRFQIRTYHHSLNDFLEQRL
jgi:hypothetical protein